MENSVCPYLQREKIEAKATRKKKNQQKNTKKCEKPADN